jgi:hypothetical protein
MGINKKVIFADGTVASIDLAAAAAPALPALEAPSQALLMASPNEKRLRFEPTLIFVPTLASSDYDRARTTEVEGARSHQDIAQTIQIMRNNNGDIPKIHDEEYTSRGLECMASSAALHRCTASKAAVVNAVLAEQERQVNERSQHTRVPDYEEALERLSLVSMKLTREARDLAVSRGISDASTALAINGN